MKKRNLILMVSMAFAVPALLFAGGARQKVAPAEKHLIVAINPDFTTFDPALSYEPSSVWVLGATYHGIYETENTIDNLVPRLAESHQISADGLTYTLKLRRDLTFNSGNPVTSADFKWSIERVINLKGNPSIHARGIERVEVPDDYTLVLHLKEVDPAFLVKLANNIFTPLDRKVLEAHGGTNGENAATADTAKEWLDIHSAGTGPYQLQSYTPNVEVVLERNPRYWAKAPYFDKITIKSVPDPNAQAMMLRAGDVDIAFNLGPEQVNDLRNAPNAEIIDGSTSQITFLLLNRDPDIGGPVANPTVQKAIRIAIDYPGIQSLAGPGVVTPPTPFPIGIVGSLPAANVGGYPRTAEAKALLAQAGYPNGFTTKFYVPTSVISGVELVVLAQKIQNDLAAIGITTELVPESVTISLDSYRQGKQPLGLWFWGSDYHDNNSQLVFLPGNTVGLRANWQAASNPDLADLGKTASVEIDNARRLTLFSQIQQALIEDAPYAVLSQSVNRYAIRKGLKGADYGRQRVDLSKVHE
jgi:peptide/nickel transport system substrate-binding protein